MIQFVLAVLLLLVPLIGECMSKGTPANFSAEYGEFINLPENDSRINRMGFMEGLSVMKEIFLTKTKRMPHGKLPEVKPHIPEFLKPSDFLKFIWLGHSTLLINVDGKIFLIDPVFGNSASPFDFMIPRFQAAAISLKELPYIDAIIISHDHYDHLDKSTIKYFENKSTRFIVPIGVGNHLRDWGIEKTRITELNWGESTSYSHIKFTATPARHFSGRSFFDRNQTLWASWVIEGKEDKIFYSGDSGYGGHFKEIGKRYGPFDLAFLENGQYNERWPDVHMHPEETLQALIDVDAKILVPVHWGMFDLALHHWTEPISRTHKIATAWEIPILTPKLGEMVDTGIPAGANPWWEEVPVTPKETPCRVSKVRIIPELAK